MNEILGYEIKYLFDTVNLLEICKTDWIRKSKKKLTRVLVYKPLFWKCFAFQDPQRVQI